ncbi:MAG: FKBP-type peptidyl-prolyl cis-trans isomerase N-terminal domain-containing protein [Alistipes sp.]
MMKKNLILLFVAMALLAGSCSQKSGGVKLRADTDSVAYILGMNVAQNLLQMDSTLNVNALCEGIRDVFRENPKLSTAEAKAFYLRYVNCLLPEKATALEEQFLQDILKSNRSYARTSSGVTYTVEAVGDQEQIPVSDRDTVVMRYLIRTADGEQLYSSFERGDTLRQMLGDLRPGVQESVKLIGSGGRIGAWMPAATVYGADGDAKLGIQPNATLYYEIELIGVDKYTNRWR